MSDHYKWNGDEYQGTPEGEKKYEYYKVGEQGTAQHTGAAGAAASEGTASQNSTTSQSSTTFQGSKTVGNGAAGSGTGASSGSAAQSMGADRQGNTAWRTGAQGYTAPGGSFAGQRTGAAGGPYPNQGYQAGGQTPPPGKTRKVRSGNGTGRKFGMAISLALVFGLVAGLAFQGVNVISKKYFHNDTGSQTQLQSTPLVDQTQNTSGAQKTSVEGSVSAVAKSAMPSVVAITSLSVQEMYNFFGGVQEYQGVSSGSGVIVGENEKELLIATNNHVVEGAKELSVCFIGNDVLTSEKIQESLEQNGGLDTDGAVSASIKGTEPAKDLAVIAVKKEEIPEETMAQIKIAQIGNSDDLEVGEQVVAIGNALGFGQSVTSGWVSAMNRDVTFEDGNSTPMVQTDAAINPGNSGGALLNMQGQLIGINSAKEAADAVEGMGYAIPIATASPILDELMTRETREKVEESKSAYMGISVQNLTSEMVQMFNMPEGAFVAEVTEGGAADQAGILQGDIITKLDGQTVSNRDALLEKLSYYEAGETVELVVHRANEGEYVAKTLTITFDKRPADAK